MTRRPFVIDAAIAIVVLAVSLGVLAYGGPRGEADDRGLDALGVLLAALASLPLVARRRAPLAVFVLTAAASVSLNGLGYPPGPPIGPTVALYFLTLNRDESRARMGVTSIVVVGFFALHFVAGGLAQGELPGPELLFGVLLWGGAAVAGDRTRLRRERIAALEERALRAEREAERERRLAAAEERTRIARDLHDSAGHAINVILVQAGAARLLHDQDPERAREALQTIEEVARDTLGEIDQLVRNLREDGSADEVEPPPGLAALEALAARHRAAGLAVTIKVHGSRRSLAPGIDRAAYRILQESLTNAARHGLASAEVDVAFGPSVLEITVTNPTRPNGAAGAAGGGHGIVGMRERAALLGGSLEAVAGDGRFRVRARLPYKGGEGA